MILLGPLFPKSVASRFLALSLALVFAIGLAACDSSPTGNDDGDNDKPTVTYEAVKGGWAGTVRLADQRRPAVLNVAVDTANAGEQIGQLVRFFEEFGFEVLCRGDLLATSSAPPEYRMDITNTEGASNCSVESFRLEEGIEAETLIAYAKPSDASSYVEAGTLKTLPPSLEAIKGEWAGTTNNGLRWGEVKITKDSAEAGERIGFSAQFEEKDGQLWCSADMFKVNFEPPTYSLEAEPQEGNCPGTDPRPMLDFRLEHEPAVGTLRWSYKDPDGSTYKLLGVLRRRAANPPV